MSNYTEKDLESFIEEYLLSKNGYIKRVSGDYDKNLCLDKELFMSFIESTQSEKLEEIKKRLGENYKEEFFKKVSIQIKEKGIVKALQTFIEVKGIKIFLAYSKPNTNFNQQSEQNYNHNTLSIIRQLHFSEQQSRDSIDIVLFLNGIPLITIELKNPFTHQNVYDAIKQYKTDRDPREPLLNRYIVYFALDSDLSFMTTKLAGDKTHFLPFNRGLNNGSGEIGLSNGAGNPPSKGVKTAYMWEKIFTKETLINLIFNFVQIVRKNDKEAIIFPRFHQFDLIEKLLLDAKENGVGQRYLIEHSAGSGKSNSISWLAHNLVSLHRIENDKTQNIFDTIIVVTDRKALDSQIRENVQSFSQDKNLIEAITQGSKQLKNALEEGKKIIITTIQKFPYILDEITQLKAKTFAILIDEAHSSQSGSNAQKLGEVIRDKDESQNEKSQENTKTAIEDEITEIIKNKKLQPNASYFAFTATPKPTTLELFGTACEIQNTKKFIPFHLYPMKQAIEEGFILDVLRGYTTYKSYYRILSRIEENPLYDKKKANAKLKAYVVSNVETIKKKSSIMIEHFFNNTFRKINGKAKAMVVISSRKNAVEYYFAFREYLRVNYPSFKAIVAFSGEVALNGEAYSESGLNGFGESVLKKEFKNDEYKFLIVAEKYQTGFDEPLLHTMYVDKTLSGVNAVQTLSRLNRICPNKEDTCVIDFVNTHEDIAKAFEPFYEQTYLGEATDDEQIFTLKTNLNTYKIYTQDEIDSFVKAILNREKEDIIHSKLDIMVGRFNGKQEDERKEFYTKAKTYLKAYSFLVQILPYEDIELEKLYILLKKLVTKLTLPNTDDFAKDILKNIDFDSFRVQLDKSQNIILKANGELKPSCADGSSTTPQTELEKLSSIVREFNEKFGNMSSEESDKIVKDLHNIKNTMAKDERILNSLKNSDKQNLRIEFETILQEKFQDIIEENFALFQQFNDNSTFKNRITQKMFEMVCANAG